MNVYIKNVWGQQTVRFLPIHKAIFLRLYSFFRYTKGQRPTVKFMI